MKQKIQGEINKHRKNRDKVAMSALQAVISSIQTLESTRNKDLTEPQILDIIEDEKKKYVESIEGYNKGGAERYTDEIKAAEYAVELLDELLPDAIDDVSESDYANIADEFISEVGAKSMREMGKVMEKIKSKYRDAIDSKIMSNVVKLKLINFDG